jgi:hypothetical protein
MTRKPHTIRFPTELHAKIKRTKQDTRRSFNEEVIKLIEEGFTLREHFESELALPEGTIAEVNVLEEKSYEEQIASIPEVERKRALEGDWSEVDEPEEITIADQVRRKLGS